MAFFRTVDTVPVSVFTMPRQQFFPRPTRPTRPTRRALLAWTACAVPAFTLGRTRTAHAGTETLVVQPLGPMPAADLDLITRALVAYFDLRIERLAPQGMPAEAYYLPRRRYRAEMILDALGRQTKHRILGVTALDISTTKDSNTDWGILGLGTIGGRTCVISSFRCKRRAPNPRMPSIRLAKTAVHEIGHTLGLDHCPNRGCLMEDARGSVLTSDRDTDLCDTCRAKLAARGFPVKRTGFRWT